MKGAGSISADGGAGCCPSQQSCPGPQAVCGRRLRVPPGIAFSFIHGHLALLVLSTRSELASHPGGEAKAPWPGERPATWEVTRAQGHGDTSLGAAVRPGVEDGRGRLEL